MPSTYLRPPPLFSEVPTALTFEINDDDSYVAYVTIGRLPQLFARLPWLQNTDSLLFPHPVSASFRPFQLHIFAQVFALFKMTFWVKCFLKSKLELCTTLVEGFQATTLIRIFFKQVNFTNSFLKFLFTEDIEILTQIIWYASSNCTFKGTFRLEVHLKYYVLSARFQCTRNTTQRTEQNRFAQYSIHTLHTCLLANIAQKLGGLSKTCRVDFLSENLNLCVVKMS